MYALCATMYWMVSGQKPVEAIERLVQDTLVPLKERRYKGEKLAVSDGFSDIVAKGMAVKREERYQNISEVLRDINTLSEEKMIENKEEQEIHIGNSVQAEQRSWKQRGLDCIFALLVMLVLGMFVYIQMPYNLYETRAERKLFSLYGMEEKQEYYRKKLKIALENQDYIHAMEYCKNNLNLKPTLVAFEDMMLIYSEKYNEYSSAHLFEFLKAYSEEWSKAWQEYGLKQGKNHLKKWEKYINRTEAKQLFYQFLNENRNIPKVSEDLEEIISHIEKEEKVIVYAQEICQKIQNEEYEELSSYLKEIEGDLENGKVYYFQDGEFFKKLDSGMGLAWKYQDGFGNIYYGEFKSGLPHGKGIQFENNFSNNRWWITEAEMYKGKVQGNCKVTGVFDSGEIYQMEGNYISNDRESVADGLLVVNWMQAGQPFEEYFEVQKEIPERMRSKGVKTSVDNLFYEYVYSETYTFAWYEGSERD